ncbi:hypothetical protein Tco_0352714 [Tanacetum coccineum]
MVNSRFDMVQGDDDHIIMAITADQLIMETVISMINHEPKLVSLANRRLYRTALDKQNVLLIMTALGQQNVPLALADIG